MADGIVGAISLGFQVTRELATYYSAFKSYHSDVDAITTRIELVSDVFERLQATIQHLTLLQIDSSKELEKLLIACIGCLNDLKTYRDKCKKEKHTPASLKAHSEKIRTLDSLVNYLQLMTQIFHIDTTNYWSDQILSRDNRLQQGLHTISIEQAVHSFNLGKIGSRMAASTQQLHSDNVQTQQQLCTMDATLRAHIEGATHQIAVHTMSQGHIQSQSTQLAAIHDKLDIVVASLQQSATNFPTSCAVRTRSINHELQSNPLDLLRCRCSRKGSLKEFMNNGRTGFFRKKYSKHIAQCPLHNPFDTGVTVGANFLIRGGRAAYFVGTGIDFGLAKISPQICYRNVVPTERSPAGRVISHGIFLFCSRKLPVHENLGVAFELTIKALARIFQQGRESITSMDQYGRTLFYRIIAELRHSTPISPVHDSPRQSASKCKNDGPIVLSDMEVFRDSESSVLLNSFIRILSEMGLETNFRNRCGSYELIIKQSSNGFTDPGIISNIFQRSEQGLRKQLINRSNFSDDIGDLHIMRAALIWPEGLRILISHGVSPYTLNKDGGTVLDEALYGKFDDAVQVFLELDPLPLTVHTWNAANDFHLARRMDGTSSANDFGLLNRVAAELSQRILGRALRCHDGQPILSNAASHGYLEMVSTTLYYAPCLTVDGAQAIWNHGFENIDLDLTSLEKKDTLFSFSSMQDGTPMCYHASRLELNPYNSSGLMEIFHILEWLYSKGAEKCTLHPEFRISAGQIIAERFTIIAGPLLFLDEEFVQVRSNIHVIIRDFQSMLAKVFSDTHHDECNCSCSTAGCNVVTSALKISQWLDNQCMDFRDERRRTLEAWNSFDIKKDIILIVFGSLGVHLEQYPQLRQSAVRAMTFDILSLTHTCHSHEHYMLWISYVPIATQEQVSDIRHVEAEDIQLLEKLLEEFEASWENYEGTFVGFIEEHWEPRMHVIVEERSAKTAGEEQLREIGVQLQQEELPEEEKEPDDFGSLDWFQRALKAVIDDNNFSEWV